MKNSGEYNEIKVKLRLIQMRDQNLSLSYNGNPIEINSVGMGGVEYDSLPENITTPNDISLLSYAQIDAIADQCGVIKAGIRDKADVMINGEGYSIKSLQQAPPALVNHTARPGWENVCAKMGVDISQLDQIIHDYWQLRKINILKEDVTNRSAASPFLSHKQYLKPILNYFLFTGSGSGDSTSPAKWILDINNPIDESTWTIYGEDFLERNSHWEKLVFSIRSKKGMGNYPNVVDAMKKESMQKWTEYFQGDYRGALHVRLGK